MKQMTGLLCGLLLAGILAGCTAETADADTPRTTEERMDYATEDADLGDTARRQMEREDRMIRERAAEMGDAMREGKDAVKDALTGESSR